MAGNEKPKELYMFDAPTRVLTEKEIGQLADPQVALLAQLIPSRTFVMKRGDE